ncbi:MAG TPA: hypothetical protein VGD37_25015 [Kofleriaceae bacterium]
MKAKTHRAKSRAVKRPAAKRAAAKRTAAKRTAAKRTAAKRPAAKRTVAKRTVAKRTPAKRPAARRTATPRTGPSRWLAFVEQHGVVLASARGSVPSVAEAVAGQPIVGSWWAHPKGRAIFAALSELDDSDDVRCFKLVDGKVTFVHRRVWPALACLAANGAIDRGRAAAIQQEHMPTGEHRNLVTPYPDWVPDDVARAAAGLTVEAARSQLGACV